MNVGKFNGELLSLDQKHLRQFYIDLLKLASSNPALTKGDYVDITSQNISAGNFTEKVHAFVRYHETEKLLIVTSYNTEDAVAKIQIPKDVAEKMALDPAADYIARDMLWREAEVGFDKNLAFELKLKPYSSFIFKIK